MKLEEINLKTEEGRLLFAALTILTVAPELQILKKTVNGRKKTPDQMLGLLEKSANAILA